MKRWIFLGLAVLVIIGSSAWWYWINRPTEIKYEEVSPVVVAPGDWPWWRGPDFHNHSPAKNVPTQWDEKTNVLWKTPIPGKGYSTPILCGNHLYLTTADEDKKEQSVIALDGETGQIGWTTVIHKNGFMETHDDNSHASATLAFDGKRLFAVFDNNGGLWVSALNLKGDILWKTKAGQFKPHFGYGSSPVLYRSFVIVLGDNDGGSFVAALHRESGKVIWSTERNNYSNYSTPIVASLAGKDQLIVHGAGRTCSYDPRDGALLWKCSGPTNVCANTPAYAGDLVVVSGGYPDKKILCVRANGTGDVTKSHVVWESPRGGAYVPSPLIHDGHVYVLSNLGILSCFELKTGTMVNKSRLAGEFYSSPVLAEDRFYIADKSGVTHILRANPEMEQLAACKLDDGAFASPVMADGRLYLRTKTHLYCLGN